jgi:hypothetical protein
MKKTQIQLSYKFITFKLVSQGDKFRKVARLEMYKKYERRKKFLMQILST